MRTAIIIPARYASTRYPGKPLVKLRGSDGAVKTLIERSWDAARRVDGISGVYVATDDERIANAVAGFGGEVLMTSADCPNGTARCAEALRALPESPDIVVNLQGDAPLTPSWFVAALIDSMRDRPDIAVATPVLRCDAETYRRFREDRANGRVGGTTAVFSNDMSALYFSKEVLPFLPNSERSGPLPVFHHVGVYAYRPEVLIRYRGWKAGILEVEEGLEQLRFLENGQPVHCVEVDARGQVFWELNNPEDVARIEAVL